MVVLPSEAQSRPPDSKPSLVAGGRPAYHLASGAVSRLESALTGLRKAEEDVVSGLVGHYDTGKHHWELLSRLKVAAECIHCASLMAVPAGTERDLATSSVNDSRLHAEPSAPRRPPRSCQSVTPPSTPLVRERTPIGGRAERRTSCSVAVTSEHVTGVPVHARRSCPFPAAGSEASVAGALSQADDLKVRTILRNNRSSLQVRGKPPLPVAAMRRTVGVAPAHVAKLPTPGSFKVPVA